MSNERLGEQPMTSSSPPFEVELASGDKWSHALKRHQALRIVDVAGGANVSVLFYNRDLLLERYNMPDTLKAQYTAFLTKGRVLFSDMGRVLFSITEDTCGWHDTLGGHIDAATVEAKYGRRRYQEARNDWYRNAHDNFLVELAKWGLGKEDLVPNVNLFSKVSADVDGKLSFVAGHASPGAMVELRAEMNVLVVLSVTPHPLDPSPVYEKRKVQLSVREVAPPTADDPCRTSRAETVRGFENTERYFF